MLSLSFEVEGAVWCKLLSTLCTLILPIYPPIDLKFTFLHILPFICCNYFPTLDIWIQVTEIQRS